MPLDKNYKNIAMGDTSERFINNTIHDTNVNIRNFEYLEALIGGGGGGGCDSEFLMDDITTTVVHRYKNNSETSYIADDIVEAMFVFEREIFPGFLSGANVVVGDTIPAFSFIDNSIYPLILILYGVEAGAYSARPNITVSTLVRCDGINIYCYIREYNR